MSSAALLPILLSEIPKVTIVEVHVKALAILIAPSVPNYCLYQTF